jgi:hypothetical protein
MAKGCDRRGVTIRIEDLHQSIITQQTINHRFCGHFLIALLHLASQQPIHQMMDGQPQLTPIIFT